MEFNPEMGFKCLKLEFQRKNDELDEMLSNLGFLDINSLLNSTEDLPCVEVLRKWGVTEVSESKCLMAFTNYEMKKVQTSMSNLCLHSQRKLINNKIGVVKKLKKELQCNNSIIKREIDKRSYKIYQDGQTDKQNENGDEKVDMNMDEIYLLREKLEKAKQLEVLKKEVEKLREKRKKYLDLPPNLKEAQEKLREAQVELHNLTEAYVASLIK